MPIQASLLNQQKNSEIFQNFKIFKNHQVLPINLEEEDIEGVEEPIDRNARNPIKLPTSALKYYQVL